MIRLASPRLALAALLATCAPAAAQNLSTGRILADVRTPISELPFAITESGSYYVTQALAGDIGIVVAASDVTIDLNGFPLVGTGNEVGIFVEGSGESVRVTNGTLRGWYRGYYAYPNGSSKAHVLENVTVQASVSDGITVPEHSRVVDCDVRGSGGVGILTGAGCIVSGCIVEGSAAAGIEPGEGTLVRDSVAASNGGMGIGGPLAESVSYIGCSAIQNGEHAYLANRGAVVRDCTSYSNQKSGYFVGRGSSVEACTATSNGQNGFLLDGATCAGSAAIASGASGFFLKSDVLLADSLGIENGSHGVEASSDASYLDRNAMNRNGGSGFQTSGDMNRVESYVAEGNAAPTTDGGSGNEFTESLGAMLFGLEFSVVQVGQLLDQALSGLDQVRDDIEGVSGQISGVAATLSDVATDAANLWEYIANDEYSGFVDGTMEKVNGLKAAVLLIMNDVQ